MQRRMFLGKLHRVTVTHADLDYEGSVTIDQDLMDAANMLSHEQVHIWNVTKGSRVVTYALPGPRGSGVICINGAAAHLFAPTDLAIIATFATMSDEEARMHEPSVVLVDENNAIVDVVREQPGPQMPDRQASVA